MGRALGDKERGGRMKRPTFSQLIAAYGAACAVATGTHGDINESAAALDALTTALRKAGLPLDAVAP